MKSQAGRAWAAAKTLKARLALFLCLAILPLGIIAVFQTAAVVRDAQSLEQQSILARTAEAAGTERALLRRAFGAAIALGVSATEIGDDMETCERIMAQFVNRAQAFTYAGFATPDGMVRCASDGETAELSTQDIWQDFIDRPRLVIDVNRADDETDHSVIAITAPVFGATQEELLGATILTLPHRLTDTLLAAQVEDVDLALMDQDGRILSASTGIGYSDTFEVLSVPPGAMGLTRRGLTFNVVRADGTQQLAALVPLIEDRVFVLGLWNGGVQNYALSLFGTLTPIFPVVMWVVAFGVGFLALDRLVLRHLRELRKRMGALSFDDPGEGFVTLDDPPAEFRQIADTYNRMIDRLLGDRMQLAANLEEKELLLREVHHRVKNNLQLIASILNMQIRSVANSDAKRVLRRVQDRVLSLSTIHKALYTGTTMAHVRADKLLDEVVQGALRVGVPPGKGIKTHVNLNPLDLDPDQAVPLALLANELVTNATKYVGLPDGGASPEITVQLTSDEGRNVTLTVENSVGTALQGEIAIDGTGLGSRLVEAFVAQLGGTSVTTEDDGLHRFQTTFTPFALEEEADAAPTDAPSQTEDA